MRESGSRRQVKPEFTGHRDLGLSRRHRLWGFDVPATDVDQFIEYDHGKAVAIIEYKAETAPILNPTAFNANIAVLQDVGNRAGLLVFGVKYKRDFSMFVVTALNARAREWVPKSTACTERDYVRLLYEIRGRTMPADMFPAAPQQPLF